MICSLRQYVTRLVCGSPNASPASVDDILAVQLLQPLMPDYFPFQAQPYGRTHCCNW